MDANTHGRREDRLWSMSSVLSAEMFRCVQLTYVEQYTQVEVAREIGLSQPMVCILLQQAHARIHNHFEKHGYTPLRDDILHFFDFDPSKI
jgi:DNA-directed RNA polymerase specialized sigma24 family protein